MVKKIIFALVALALIVSLWMHLRGLKGFQLTQLTGKVATLKRGNLTIPITANGTIEPKDRVTIKSEAGGTVAEIAFRAGAMVRAGDLLIKLDPEDEQRKVDIFTKALKQAEINLERSNTTLHQRQYVDLPFAEARLDQITAEAKYSQFTYDRTMKFLEEGVAHEDEWRRVESQHLSLLARKAQAAAEVERGKSNIELAKLDLQQAELAVARAKDDLADAQERLKETRIVAPSDGMVSKLFVKKGEVIVSGSRSLTGGTPLATLADSSEFYVRALVDEADIGRVREIAPRRARPGYTGVDDALASRSTEIMPIDLGTPVKVTVETFPDEEFEGVIDVIEPEPEKGQVVISYVVRIRLTSDNSDKLFIGSQANVEFVSESVKDVVLVPNEAVRYVAGERGVYLQVDSEKVPGKKVPRFKPFRAGLDNGMYTQVIEGLEEEAVVYTKLPQNRFGQKVTDDED